MGLNPPRAQAKNQQKGWNTNQDKTDGSHNWELDGRTHFKTTKGFLQKSLFVSIQSLLLAKNKMIGEIIPFIGYGGEGGGL